MHRLWLRGNAPVDYASNGVVYSAEIAAAPAPMRATLFSAFAAGEGGGDGDCDDETRGVALALLLLSALPCFWVSLFLWAKHGVASIPLPLFATASFAAVCVALIADPHASEIDEVREWQRFSYLQRYQPSVYCDAILDCSAPHLKRSATHPNCTIDEVLKWWFTAASALWLGAMLVLHLANRARPDALVISSPMVAWPLAMAARHSSEPWTEASE